MKSTEGSSLPTRHALHLWMQIYSPEGILNTILSNFGIDAQPFIYGA